MQKIGYVPGTKYLYHGQVVRITRIVDLQSVLVEFVQTGALMRLSVDALQPLPAEQEKPAQNSPKANELHAIPNVAWQKAQQRFETIRPILEQRGNLQLVEAVSKATGKSINTLYRWLRQYDAGGSVMALVDRPRPGGKGKARIAAELDAIIREAIKDHYLSLQKKSISRVVIEITKQCRQTGLTPPGHNTVRRRIQSISEEERTRHRLGPRAAQEKFEPLKGHIPGAESPMALVQIDHTLLNIILLDEEYRRPVGRPWITVALDVFSRMVVGIYLSFDPPGTIGTAMCIANAISSKELYLSKLKVEGSWPCWGVMQTIHLDNAREFWGKSLELGCLKYNIQRVHRPVGKPEWGGHVERFMGTLKEHVKSLPGATDRNLEQRKVYDPEKEAAFTLPEFEQNLVTFIVNVYHQREHSALGKSPLERYKEGVFGLNGHVGTGLFERIANEQELKLDFMPIKKRTVQTYGVRIGCIDYWDDVLRRYMHSREGETGDKKRQFIFKLDPRNISYIYFFDPDTSQYHKIPYANNAAPPMSLWEYNEVRKRRKASGGKVDEKTIFEGYDQMKQTEMKAVENTQKLNKTRNRIMKGPFVQPENGLISLPQQEKAALPAPEEAQIMPPAIKQYQPFDGLIDEAFTS